MPSAVACYVNKLMCYAALMLAMATPVTATTSTTTTSSTGSLSSKQELYQWLVTIACLSVW